MRLVREHVGVTATHRAMNTCITARLDGEWRNRVRVDTPERWQGLERPVMIAVHPLSGVTRPSTFDLETGRLCVMASRHKIALVIVARDHITDTLAACLPAADQALGRPDVAGAGHFRNESFWQALTATGRVVAVG